MTRCRLALFLVPLLLAPIPLGARSQGELGAVGVAPRPGTTTTVDGITVTASVRVEGKRLVVMVASENPTKGPLTRRLRVAVMERAEANPMARMAPMPRMVGSETLTVALEPGQKLDKELVLTAREPIRNPGRLLVWVSSDNARAAAPLARTQRGGRWRMAQNAGR